MKFGVQVVALGDRKFRTRGLSRRPAGLEGWAGDNKMEYEGEWKDGTVVFPSEMGRGELKEGVLRVLSQTDEPFAEFKKVERKSPTLGAKPPKARSCCLTARTPSNSVLAN